MGGYYSLGQFIIALALFVLLLLGVLCRRYAQVLTLTLAAIIVGLARVQSLPSYQANPYDVERTITGVVVREVEERVSENRFTVKSSSLDGLLLVTANRFPALITGDVVSISCTLRRPEPINNFRYDRWLARYGIGTTCYYPKISLVGHRDSATSLLMNIKSLAVRHLKKLLPPPEVGIIQGAMFGQKWAPDLETMTDFRQSGTSHLLVISGLHISLLVSGLFSLAKIMRRSRRQALGLIIGTLLLYVLITGVQPSAVRAALMSGVSLSAYQFGRSATALRLLVMIATVMLMVNPLLLYDVGFQLSLAATAGIVLFSDTVSRRLTLVPDFWQLRKLMGVTLAAILTTTPIIASNFGTLSLISPITNLLLVPLMPIVMLGAGIVLLLSFISIDLGQLLALPVSDILHAMIYLSHLSRIIPGASITLPEIPPWFSLLSALIIGWGARSAQVKVYE